ncbi:MAG: sugar phosphate isomerase/epimerase [Saprospiraceae bacterium]|nr:sugar phosphate isomerase/epimerase [Saprospiraceae bacterium]
MNRRQFLTNTATITAAVATLDSYAAPLFQSNAASKLKIMATNWGFNGSMDAFCAKAKTEGYDGIEVWWTPDPALFEALKKYELEVGFLVGAGEKDYDIHLANFIKNLEAATNNKMQRPLYINCHSGKDFFSFEQNLAFFDATTKISKQTGIIICHETHRGRILYNAPLTKAFMEKRADLTLTVDLSHWCCVHESLLGDIDEIVMMALDRADHIHARVGHAEGPQVSDPRAPEWATAVNAHFRWWDKVVERKRNAGEDITILTEFGPPDYLWSLPYTRQPIANQWDINVHMMQILRKRYS